MKNPPPDSLQAVGLETLLGLLAVSAIAGSARSVRLNNDGGRCSSRYQPLSDQLGMRPDGALRHGKRQTHEEKNSTHRAGCQGEIALLHDCVTKLHDCATKMCTVAENDRCCAYFRPQKTQVTCFPSTDVNSRR